MSVLMECLLAYIVVDALTGIYHLLTDKGWNFQHQVDLFKLHHETNSMDGFDWQPLLAAVPLLAVGAWIHSPFLTAASLVGCVAQVPHYLAHEEHGSKAVKFLQWSRIIMHPNHHAVHHNGKFTRNYCILSGWNNWWMNGLLFLLGA